MTKPKILPPYQRNFNSVTAKDYKPKVYVPLKKRSDYISTPTLQVPVVYYTAKAWDKIRWLVDQCPIELGWVGAVEQVHEFEYVIHDVGVMDQEAGAASFEFDDWNKPVNDMIIKGTMRAGMVDANLGHSHVNMAVRPSGTDEEQLMDMARIDEASDEPQSKFSIQTIVNKQGDHHAAVYDWENGNYYDKCDVEVLTSLDTEDIQDLVEQLKRVQPYKRTYGAYGTYGTYTPSTTQAASVKKEDPAVPYYGLYTEDDDEALMDYLANFNRGVLE